MKTNKRLERYFLMLKDMYYLKEFQIYHVISAHKVSKNVTKALLELELIKKQNKLPLHNFIGKKPTKQMAQMLIDKVSLYYKKNDFVKKIKEYKQSITINENDILNLPSFKHVNIINETKEQPFLLSFTWVDYNKIKSFWKEKIIKSYAVTTILVYAIDYKSACDKLRLKYKDSEIIYITDLTIR